jgi:hypothetical protein
MGAVGNDVREIKADVKAILEITTSLKTSNEVTFEKHITLKKSVDVLWDQFDKHKEGHWKWIALVLGVIALGSFVIDRVMK